MTTYSVIPFIALLAYMPLFALVAWHRPWQRQHKLLVIYLITAMVWSLTSFLLHSSFLLEYKTLLVKVIVVSMMWMVTHYYHFARDYGYKPGDFGVRFGYAFTLLFVILAVLGYIPQYVVFTPGKPIIIEHGVILWLIALPMLTLAGMLLFSLVKKLHISSDPVERNRVAYMLISASVLTVFMSTNIFPLLRGYPIDHLGNLINAIILTYATVRHELVSIKLLARRGLVSTSSTIIIAALYFLTLGFLVYGLRFNFDLTTVIIAVIITGILSGTFWYPMQRSIIRLVDQFLYGKHLNYRKEMLDFTRHAQNILSLENIGEEMTRIVAGATGARAVGLFIQKEGDFVCEFVFPKTESETMSKLKLRQDSPIAAWLTREGKYLARDDLNLLPEFDSLWQEEKKAITVADIEYFLPLIAQDKLVAILALTRAKTTAGYDIDDINLLQNLTGQVAIMISNAQLYSESQRLGEELQLVNRLTQIITSSLDINQVYEVFVKELRRIMDADWASVSLIEGDKLRFFLLSTTVGSPWKTGETIPLEGTATQYIAKTKQFLIEEDLLKHHRFWTGVRFRERGIRSIVYIPLLARGEAIGSLTIGSCQPNAYGTREISLLERVSSQLATAVENFRLYHRTQEEAVTVAQLYAKSQELGEELQLINRLTQIITSSLDINEVYERFVQELRKRMPADWAAVCLLEGDQLRFFGLSAITSSAWKTGETIPLEGTATAYVAKTKKTFVEEDLLKHHRFWTGAIHLQQGIRSIVYTPLVVRGKGIGALVIGSYQPNAYSTKEINLLEQVSGQLATAVENSRLYTQIQQQAITDALTGLFNRRYFEERLTEEINRHTRYGGVFSIVMLDLDFFKVYNDTYGHQAGDKILREIAQRVKELVRTVDLCFRYGGDEFVLLLPQTLAQEAYQVAERIREQVDREMKAKGIAVTLSAGIASWPADGVTTDDLVQAADDALLYAKQTGGNQCCLFSRITPLPVARNRHPVANEKIALNIIHALSAIADAKDHYSYNHSRKVAAYATTLAEAIGLPQDKIAIINTAALLHDIGKIGIPDQILNKPGKLTAEEWECVKRHTTLGATIISHIPSLAPCLPIIFYHHEWYNGHGYPHGLKAEEPPLEARILTIADAFAAMTSPRPYRPALSYQEAIEELKKGANTQFDPELVEKFIPIVLSLAPERNASH